MMKELPRRKHPRLKHFDYSSEGAYFVTICTQNRRCVLSQIVGRGLAPAENHIFATAENHIFATAENHIFATAENHIFATAAKKPHPFAAGDVCKEIKYTKFGEIAERQLLLLEERYKNLLVDKYVIMPNHIHVIFILKSAGASPRRTMNMNEKEAGASPRRTMNMNENVAGASPRPAMNMNEKEAGASPCPAMNMNKKEAGASPCPTVMDIVCAYKSLTTRECKRNGFSGKLFQTSFYEHIIRNQEDYDRIFGYIHENPTRWMFDVLYEDVQT